MILTPLRNYTSWFKFIYLDDIGICPIFLLFSKFGCIITFSTSFYTLHFISGGVSDAISNLVSSAITNFNYFLFLLAEPGRDHRLYLRLPHLVLDRSRDLGLIRHLAVSPASPRRRGRRVAEGLIHHRQNRSRLRHGPEVPGADRAAKV